VQNKLIAFSRDGIFQVWDTEHEESDTTHPKHIKTYVAGRTVFATPLLNSMFWSDEIVATLHWHHKRLQFWKLPKISNSQEINTDPSALQLIQELDEFDDNASTMCRWNDWFVISCEFAIEIWDFELQKPSERGYCDLKWSVNLKKLGTLEGHTAYVCSMLACGDKLWSSSSDRTIRIWNRNLACVRVLSGYTTEIASMCRWGGWVVSASLDKTLRVYNMDGILEHTISTRAEPFSLCVWDKYDLLCCGISNGNICIYNKKFECINTLKQRWNGTTCMITKGDLICSLNGRMIYIDEVPELETWLQLDINLVIWKYDLPWEIVRLIWIGWMRHTPMECPFAMLPKELIVNIIHRLKKSMLYDEHTEPSRPKLEPVPRGYELDNSHDNNSDVARDSTEAEDVEAVSLKRKAGEEPGSETDALETPLKRSKHKTVY